MTDLASRIEAMDEPTRATVRKYRMVEFAEAWDGRAHITPAIALLAACVRAGAVKGADDETH